MKKSPILFFLILFLLAPTFAQSSRTLDDIFAGIVASEFPKYELRKRYGGYGTTPVKITQDTWEKGKGSSISISAIIADTPDEIEENRRHFFRRPIMPRGAPVSGLGEKAVLLSTCTRVEISFLRENVLVSLNYMFRRGCDRPVPDWTVSAPVKEIERATNLAHSLYAEITKSRSMTPCDNDLVNTYFPRPTNPRERMLEAALNGNTETIKSLLAKGVVVSDVDSEGNSPLHLAVRHGCVDTMQRRTLTRGI